MGITVASATLSVDHEEDVASGEIKTICLVLTPLATLL